MKFKITVITLLLLVAAGYSAAAETAVRQAPPTPEVIAKLPPDGGPEFNRLVFEQSPYLLQHCRNPVDWYPWGEAAFKKAAEEGKPIFMSIGYSTCHWCHVMEHESFEDPEVAKLMNKYFVCIKVDREERPDIDQVYMTVTQAMTGSGGWPMTIVMTADKKPFFAGTYFPKTGQYGRPGMMQLIPYLGEAWKKDKAKAIEFGNDNAKALGAMTSGTAGPMLDAATLDLAFKQFSENFDARRGGFSKGSKFPAPHNLSFLLRYWKRTGNPDALNMAEKTLTALRLGGVYDHVGFGTHRYATDPDWLLPHFEKMLYDQALLVIANVEAWQATGKEAYARTAREILTYVLRDMTSPEGAFYSAEDADSEGEEGKFYVWERSEILKILGEEEGRFFCDNYNVIDLGNFKDEATGRRTGANVVYLAKPLNDIARDRGLEITDLAKRLEASREKLFAVREKRVHPYKDDKVLTDWNGLMIVALAKAAQALDEPQYAEAARKAADFILTKLVDERGRLLKRYRGGTAGLPAHLEDYAFVTWGLIDLYEATFETRYLAEAIRLTDAALEHYWDDAKGGFFLTADDGEALLVRSKEAYDNAVPSGNSVFALNLARLERITTRREYAEKGEALVKAFAGDVAKAPIGYPQLLIAVDFILGPTKEVVIAGEAGSPDTREMLQALRAPFVPNKVVVFRPDGEAPPITRIAPYTAGQVATDGKATAYVCENFACKLPTTDVAQMKANLAEGAKVLEEAFKVPGN